MDQILINLKMKTFYRKFYNALKVSPFVTLIEIYEDEYRISFKKRNKIYYKIFNYCVDKLIECDGHDIVLTNGEERFKMIIKF
jgi:hypothetical protein